MKVSKKKFNFIKKILLGVVVFFSVVGVVLGLSILFGVIKSPITSEEDGTLEDGASTQSSGIVYEDVSKTPQDLFPYETETFKVVYLNDQIVVYLYPSLLVNKTVDEQIVEIKAEINAWLRANGIDPDASSIDWRTK